MIARTWRGSTRPEDADRYLDYLGSTGIAAYSATPGNRGIVGLRRIREGRADFVLLTLWDSEQAVRAFAGDQPARAVFYPEDDAFLIDGDETAEHFEVVVDTRPRSWLGRIVAGWWRAWQATFEPRPHQWKMAAFR